MADIANLAIKVDSKELVTAKRNLENIEPSARKAQRATDGLASSFAGFVRGINPATIAIAAFTAGTIKSIQKSKEYQTEQRQLEAVVRSTGMAAGFSVAQLNKMADAFERTTSFTAGEVNNAQTRLLSYSGVVGQTFPEAMQITIDMAARMGMSLEQSAETIGRALDIPSQGLSALSRQGFRFTEAQKQVVEQLEATGKVAEAQKIIIDTVTASYGGAAEALNTGLTKASADAKKAYDDLLTTIGQTSLVQSGAENFWRFVTNSLNTVKNIITDGKFLDSFQKLTALAAGGPLGLLLSSRITSSENFSQSATGQIRASDGGTVAERLERESILLAEKNQQERAISEEAEKQRKIKEEAAREEAIRVAEIRKSAREEIEDNKKINDLLKQGLDISQAQFIVSKQREGFTQSEIKLLTEQQNLQNQLLQIEQDKINAIKESQEAQARVIDWQQRKATENFNQAQLIHKEMTESQKDNFEDLKNAIDGYSRDMSRSLAEFAVSGKMSFGDMIQDMTMRMLQFVNQRYIFDPLFKSLSGALDSGGGISGFLGSIGSIFNGGVSASAGAYGIDENPYLNFGGARATGGPVSAGKTYLVGERGMELFTPNTSGSITPNNKMSGNQVVNIQVIEAEGTRANVQQQQNPDGTMSIKLIVEQLYGVMNRDLQRGNGIAPTLERRYGLNRMAGT
jgi:phage-related minor tail protein